MDPNISRSEGVTPLFNSINTRKIMYIFRLLLLLSLTVLIACKEEKAQDESEDQFLPDSVNTDGMAVAPEFLISPQGLAFVELGTSINDLPEAPLGDTLYMDTLVSEGGYDWVTRTLHLDDGRIVVEGNYLDSRVANDTALSLSQVNRIQVYSPRFMTREGLGVGSKVRQLQEVVAGQSVFINPIVGYDALEIGLESQPKLRYLVRDAGNALARSVMEAGRDLSLDDIPAEEELFAVVLLK